MTNGFEEDINFVWANFVELTTQEMDRAIKKALKRGATEIKNQTVSNAKNGIKTRNNPHYQNGKRIEYNDDITDAVRIGRIEDNYDSDAHLSIKVHVMGTSNVGSGTYRFRFLEGGAPKNGGTREAKTYKGKQLKKRRNLGTIAPRKWFRDANQTVDLDRIYVEVFEDAINKINNGK